MKYNDIATVALVFGFAMAGFAASASASPYGLWKRPKTGAHIKVDSCSGGLGMKVIKSPDPKAVGKRLMCGAKSAGANKWRGNLKSTDGNTYTGIVTLVGNSLKLQGCVLGGLICRSETWSKIK